MTNISHTQGKAIALYGWLGREFGTLSERADEIWWSEAGEAGEDSPAMEAYHAVDGELWGGIRESLEGADRQVLCELQALAEEMDEDDGGRIHVAILHTCHDLLEPPMSIWEHLLGEEVAQ